MTQHALLSNTDHRDLRVITGRNAEFGDNVMFALTFPSEFRNVQGNYPIVFAKSREGTMTPLALFGFREGQNLFLHDGEWDAPYLPLMIARQPFLIGSSSAGKVIHIDLDHPRVSRTEGERLFDDEGNNTRHLDRVGTVLAAIDEGVAMTTPFMAALAEHQLLDSFALDIEFRDGAKHHFAGFYTVQDERLRMLSAAALGDLHSRGFLLPIFMVAASLSNFRELIERASVLDPADR